MKFRSALAVGLIAAGTLSQPARAALSGYWESSKVLHAILGRNEVADALRQQPISSIETTRSGYRLKSRDCTVDVTVERQNTRRPGPGNMKIMVGNGRCR